MATRKYWLETYGCQMNKAESEALALSLTEGGWIESESALAADLVILNTCSVRETAEQRVWGRLGFYRRLKRSRPFTLVLTGCMAERLKERIPREFPEVNVVLGTLRKGELLEALNNASVSRAPLVMTGGDRYEFSRIHSTGGFRAFIPIMHGCNNNCSYCIVPRVRGPEVSREPGEILAEIHLLEQRGIREITLLGQNVNSYSFPCNGSAISFSELLRMVREELGAIRRVRFLTSHPRDFSDSIIDAISESDVFCRHVHLPLQSGSDRILDLMNRGYTTEQYSRLVQKIREGINGVSITTDILIGFPSESEIDFQDTLRMMETIRFDDAFTYYYNPREGTPAYVMADALPQKIKLEHLSRTIEIQRSITRENARSRLGMEIDVLVEDVSKKSPDELLARTEWDSMAVLPGAPHLLGQFVKVKLQSLLGNTYRAIHT